MRQFVFPCLASFICFALAGVLFAQDIRAIIEPVTREGVEVWLDKDCYEDGETLIIHIKAERDGYLTVYDFTPGGQGTKLFPNPFYPDNRIKGGVEYRIPPAGAPFSIKVDIPSGASAGDEELIWVIVTEKQASLPETGRAPFLAGIAEGLLADQGWWAAAIASFRYGPCEEPPPAPTGNKYALLVGVDDYDSLDVPDLFFAVNEVSLFDGLFRKLGYETKVLTDAQATKGGIKEGIEEWLSKAGAEGTAIFVFAGWGSGVEDEDGDESDGQDEVILPADFEPPDDGWITDDELAEWLTDLGVGHIGLILDVPFGGYYCYLYRKGVNSCRLWLPVLPPLSGSPDGMIADLAWRSLLRSDQLVVGMEACHPNEQFWACEDPEEGLGNWGIFGYYVYRALVRGGSSAKEIFDYARERVQKLTEKWAERFPDCCPSELECVMHPELDTNGDASDFQF